MKNNEILNEAKRVLSLEAAAISGLEAGLGEDFLKAVDLIFQCQGKLVTTGVGKSGIIARKIASTMSSTGTPSIFIHPVEGFHGDFGVLLPEDVILALSYSGEASELVPILNFAARKGIKVIALTGKKESVLGNAASVVLSVAVAKEACPLGLAPTSSSTATLAMGDALAMVLLKLKGFDESEFAEFHPGGSLGRRLLTRVKDVMHSGPGLPLVPEDMSMGDVISVMTSKEVRGAAGVLSQTGNLVGIITDGDIRRALQKTEEILKKKASEIMNCEPKTIELEALAEKALLRMEELRIQSLFVMEGSQPVGLVHLQDLLTAKIR